MSKSTNLGKTVFFQGICLIFSVGVVLSLVHLYAHFYIWLPSINPEVKSVCSHLPPSVFLITCILPYTVFLVVGCGLAGFCKALSRKAQIITISVGAVLAVLLNGLLLRRTLVVCLKLPEQNIISEMTYVGVLLNLAIVDIAIHFNRFEEFRGWNKPSIDISDVLGRIETLWVSFLHLALALGAATALVIGVIWSSITPGLSTPGPLEYKDITIIRLVICVVFAILGLAVLIFVPLDERWKELLKLKEEVKDG